MPTTLSLRIADTIDRTTLVRRTLGVILAIVAGLALASVTNGPPVASGVTTSTSPEAAACILARAAPPCALLSP